MDRVCLPTSFAISALLHLLGLLFAANRLTPLVGFTKPTLVPVTLVESHSKEASQPPLEKLTAPEPAKPVSRKRPQAVRQEAPEAPVTTPPAVPSREERSHPLETKGTEPSPAAKNSLGTARSEGGGSESGGGSFSDKSESGVATGPGSAGSGGMAGAGLGRGATAPGLPGQGQARQTNREAKPLKFVRALYPAMALRAGLESDVTLKIEVDAQGNVTKAEVIKSGGAGFDDEAVKAIKHARFEPAQRDGQAVAAQFTYVYRFRLQR